jgi:Amt family ammonium transporter
VTWAQFGVQVVGALAYFFWPFITCLILFSILKATVGLRTSAEEELAGLDVGEHGNVAYPDFVSAAANLEQP